MMMRTIKLRTLSEVGQIEKATVVDALGEGFNLLIKIRANMQPILLQHSRTDKARVFKTIDACVKCCRDELGLFGVVEVIA